MTIKIDIHAFSAKVRKLREDWEDWQDTFDSYREYLATELSGSRHLWQPVAARTAENLRDELVTAARAAYLDGASDAQINLIVSLCTAKGDFARMGYSRLTKRDASRLIDDLKREA